MPARKRNVEIEILVDDKRAVTSLRNIDQATAKTSKGFGQLSGAVKVAAGAFVASHAVDFVGDLVNASSDLSESINAVNKTFGPFAEGIHQIGETSAEAFGLSTAAFNQFAVRFSAFATKIAEEDGRDVVDIIDEMATRVADFASVHNLSLEEAATVATSTLAGETEAFRRFGGDVSAATVKTKAYEMGIAEAGAELTEGQKILARYALFMQQTDKTAGDFADTADELANKQRILNAEWENAKARVGDALVPVLETLLSSLDPLIQGVSTLATEWGKLIALVEELDASPDPFDQLQAGILGLVTKGALPFLIDQLEKAGDLFDKVFGSGRITGGGSRTGSSGGTSGGSGQERFHSGGIVPGVPGEDVPIVAQAGETVLPIGGGMRGGQTVINYYPGTTIGNERVLRELLEMARRQ